MLPAEIAFHRYFGRPEITARYHYLGKQPLEELGEEFGRQIEAIQDRINTGYELTKSRVLVDGRHPLIYCDFIKPNPEGKQLISAHAFYDGERYFIGLTTPLIVRLFECAGYLAHSPHVRRVFVIPFGDGFEKDKLRGAILQPLFFGHQLNFVFGHEFGHHFLGHTINGDDCFWKEFALESIDDRESSPLTSHAHEIQADSYASEYLLSALLETDILYHSLCLLGRSLTDAEAKELMVGIYVISICAVLFALPNLPFTEKSLTKDHPLKAARLSNMMSSMEGYLNRLSPDLAGWLTLEKFNGFAEAVKSSIPPIGLSWDEETSYLLSPSGARYYKDLMEEAMRLNRTHNPYRWQPVQHAPTI